MLPPTGCCRPRKQLKHLETTHGPRRTHVLICIVICKQQNFQNNMVDNVSSSPPPKMHLHEKFESNFCLTSSLSTDNQAFSGIRGLRLQPASTMGKAEVAIFQISAISSLDQIAANARGTISRNKYFRPGKRTHLPYQLLINCPTSHSPSQFTRSQLDRG